MTPIRNIVSATIAHVIDTDGPGGAERVVAHLATTLQASGVRNVALMPPNGEGWLARQLEGSGVTIDYFSIDGNVASCAKSLEAALRRHRITLAHSHEFSMAVCGAWACRGAAIPHVITMHGGRYYAGRLRRRLGLRAAFAWSARTVAVSSRLAAQLSRDLWMRPSRIATIPNGVRRVPGYRFTVRDELRLGPKDRLLVAVGNLYPVKGHRHLIDALALLAGRHPNVHLAISGRGDLADALATQAAAHHLSSRVHFLGLRPDVSGILAAADIFVLPSLSEGLPLALLEAMFAGCAIVATNVGDVGVALGDGEAGVLVEPGDAAALAAAIDRLLVGPDRALHLGRCAARRAAAEYDLSHMVRRYVDTYTEALGRPAAFTDLLPRTAVPHV
jgi:glycosyltransferase involved in cell wall biosynthesis